MAFTAGDILCCPSLACVLLDVNEGSTAETWDLIPHATQIGFTKTVTDQSLVTSSSAGEEISACGVIKTEGTLSLACHNGIEPALFCANGVYRIRWSLVCDRIWTAGAVVATPDADLYFEALIRILTVPILFDISGNQPIVYNYTWKLISWGNYPDCQPESE